MHIVNEVPHVLLHQCRCQLAANASTFHNLLVLFCYEGRYNAGNTMSFLPIVAEERSQLSLTRLAILPSTLLGWTNPNHPLGRRNSHSCPRRRATITYVMVALLLGQLWLFRLPSGWLGLVHPSNVDGRIASRVSDSWLLSSATMGRKLMVLPALYRPS